MGHSRRFAMLLTVFTAAFSLAAAPARSDEYLGDFCWMTANGIEVTLALSRIGNRHFSISGTADNSLPGEITVIDGSATVANDRLFMTVTFTGEDNERFFAGNGRIVVDLATWDGEFQFLELGHPKASPNPTEAKATYSPKAALTAIPCN